MANNRYPGKCRNCGMEIPAMAGNRKFEGSRWVVYHIGPCPDVTSGLGIGGAGSDDYNIHTESTAYISTGKPRRNGGGQLWEDCPKCGNQPVHLDCGYCDKHCRC